MNKQCWHSQWQKIAFHDNNVGALMDDSIFFNILAAEKKLLYESERSTGGNVAKQGHKAEQIAPTATQDRATVPM